MTSQHPSLALGRSASRSGPPASTRSTPTTRRTRPGPALNPAAFLAMTSLARWRPLAAEVTPELIGRKVMAMTAFPRGQGGYAEYAVVDEPLAAYLPDDADLVAAASVPLAAGTAWEVLESWTSLAPHARRSAAAAGSGSSSSSCSRTRHPRHRNRPGEEPRPDAHQRRRCLRRLSVTGRHHARRSTWLEAPSTRSPTWSADR